MPDNTASIIAKVQKLLSLAKNNANQNEMKAATAAADRLIQEYRISQAQLEAIGDKPNDDPIVHKVTHAGGRRTNWREVILWALTKQYGCVWYMTSSRSRDAWGKEVRSCNYTVVGRQSDTDIVDYMFAYLTGEIERLGKLHSRGYGVGYGKSWLEGAAQGVSAQFRELQEETRKVTTSTAMVLLDQRGKEAQAYMKTNLNVRGSAGSIGGARSSADAHSRGYQVGKNIKINKGLPS